MLAEKTPSQFGDALGAFWGVGCTDEDSQIGQQFQSLQPLLKASTETCSQVALPIRENLSVSSAPVKAWNWKAGKTFVLSAPMALHIGSILINPRGH